MNVHDSQRIEHLLRGAGYQLVDAPEGAEVVVLNTCSVREKAEQKLRSEAGRLKKLDTVLVVAGCVAQQEGERLLKAMPYLDVVVGPDNLGDIPSLVREAQLGGRPTARTVFDLDAPSFLTGATSPGSTGASAYVTVMKGCDERCTFCVVPYTRGPERYRPADQILAEVRALVDAGAREVVLLGQTVNSYRDPSLGGPTPDDRSEFPELLGRIAREVPHLNRLRYTSPHPRHLTPALEEAHRALGVLARHVHLPVQSGSDRVLKRMLRRYTRAEYERRARSLLAAVPGLTLTTDIIVGFPGETRGDFEETLGLVEALGFVGVFAFKYSPRPLTPSLKLDDDVPEDEKQSRLQALFAVTEALTQRHLEGCVGTVVEVLVEGPSRPGARTVVGRTRRNEIAHLAPLEGARAGAVVEAEVLRAHKHSLEARGLRVLLEAPGAVVATRRRVALPVVAV
ncbi:MAG: tRNA (N6-isopentenyl adenosine(37)-C2)-methylthiotransferase MiaB [Deltaproteobacteria bacterium]|nr:tRNA (N6-isopentenyl adenosine(37)-C2)-methylthiotransferase MiaB [Deltaproteobacteria bacterium]